MSAPRRVTIEVTEYQARILRLAVQRFVTVHPLRVRGRLFEKRAYEALAAVEGATDHLEPLPLPVVRRR